MLYPLTFEPIFKERVWGGRRLARLYGKALPPDVRIGESWEITDRPEGVSRITNGPLAGRDLRWLMENRQRELLGDAATRQGRFPLLIKLLDAEDKLSLQVHPPASRAKALDGEPKTEMWYIADARPGAEIYVGLEHGVSRVEFERRIGDGTVAGCFHRIRVRPGDAMFLPSGRVHAIGAGLVIFEIQQNSDTTYRVFDWNRIGLDGKPRDLHVQESLQCIDFEDYEPSLVTTQFSTRNGWEERTLVSHELFDVRELKTSAAASLSLERPGMMILACLKGSPRVVHHEHQVSLNPGGFCLVPAVLQEVTVDTDGPAQLLAATPGCPSGESPTIRRS